MPSNARKLAVDNRRGNGWHVIDETPRFQRFNVHRRNVEAGTIVFVVTAKSERRALRECVRRFGHMLGSYDRRARGQLQCGAHVLDIHMRLMH